MIQTALLSIAFIAFVFAVCLHLRNNQIYKFRGELHSFVFGDGQASGDWKERLTWLDCQPDYNEMVFRFWRRPQDMLDGEYAEKFRQFYRSREAKA